MRNDISVSVCVCHLFGMYNFVRFAQLWLDSYKNLNFILINIYIEYL